ncbi:DUF3734 domain-containing protein [Variovorax sp. N23]
MSIARIVRPVGGDESVSRNFDFSITSIRASIQSGYDTAIEVLGKA